MPDTTAVLAVPYLTSAQGQKHVTVNEGFQILDAAAHLSVIDRGLTAPPGGPSEGDRYIVAGTATDDWAGWEGDVAAYVDGAWLRLQVAEGWRAWIEDENILAVYDGAAWVPVPVAIAHVTGLQTALDARALVLTPIRARTGTSETLATDDGGAIVTMSNGSPSGLTIPAFATLALAAGARIEVVQLGAGAVTITAASGVSLNGVSGGAATLTGAHARVLLICLAEDAWLIDGAHGGVS